MSGDPQLDEGVQERTCVRRNRVVVLGSITLAALMALAVLDGVGKVDAFGVDTGTVRAREGRTTLAVRYPAVTRPALASPLVISVEQEGGFDRDTVEITLSTDYLSAWDLNGIVPVPAAETADGERTTWTFDAPDGDVLQVHVDARIEPGRQSDASARIAVLDPDHPGSTELVAVELTTRIRP